MCWLRYLLKQGAFPAPVNNDGKSPLELLDEVEEGEDGEDGNTRQNICKMLKDAINRQGDPMGAPPTQASTSTVGRVYLWIPPKLTTHVHTHTHLCRCRCECSEE